MNDDQHMCTDYELCPICMLCEGGCCECTDEDAYAAGLLTE